VKTSIRGFGEISRIRWSRFTARYQGPDARFYDSPIVFPGKLYAKGWLIHEKRLIDSGTWTPPTGRPLGEWRSDPAMDSPAAPGG
jgi:hypothetical protein